MGLVGKKIRMSRIFKDDGKALIVTMDHGPSLGPVKGLEDIRTTVKRVFASNHKPDAILLTPSMIRLCFEELAGKAGIVARIDGTATMIGPDITNWRLFSSVEEALSLGVDAVCTMAFFGVEREAENSEKVGKISQRCARFGMPHVVEALPPDIITHHFKHEAEWKWPDPEKVKFVARVAAELGADVVKSYYTGDSDSFGEVVKCCPVPIVVLSGPGAKDPQGLIKIVRGAMDAGAKGVIMGRNLWGYRNPATMAEAVSRLVHEDISVEKALKILS
ncbi:MAG: fructose-bisphosphate aldolase [Candidatus Bathyarchaeia archaeon]